MTCESVTVEYPSSKLLNLVNAAIDKQNHDLAVFKSENDKKDAEQIRWFDSLTRFQKFWRVQDWLVENGKFRVDIWNERYDERDCKRALSELRKVALACRGGDVVRISGDCLARIDAWAGR